MAHTGRKNADDALALALASGVTVEEAAKQAGLSVRTAHRRRADPKFALEVGRLRRAALDQSLGLLTAGAVEATATLCALLKDESPTIRLRAAVAVLQACLKLREEVDLEERLAELEAKINDSPTGKRAFGGC